MSDNAALLIAVIGSTGSGKSHFVNAALDAKPARLLIWDINQEYQRRGAVVRSAAKLLAALRKAGRGPFALVFVPDARNVATMAAQFDFFCKAALACGDLLMVVEELADVTKAGYSPDAWRVCVTRGRHKALRIIGTSQRPALLDKTFFSNATHVRVGKLTSAGDKKTMADALDIPVDCLRALLPRQWLEKNLVTGELKAEGGARLPGEAAPGPVRAKAATRVRRGRLNPPL